MEPIEEVKNPAAENDFFIPTRQQVVDKRNQEQEGYWFRLLRTGGYAHIRLLSVLDRATLTGLSSDMQNRVLAVFSEATQDGGGPANTVAKFIKNRDQMERLANVICCASFIQPRLVMTDAELDGDPHTLLVTDLHIDERLAVYNIVMGTDVGRSEEKKLVPFRGKPAARSVESLPAPEVRDSPIGLSGNERGWIQHEEPSNAGFDGAGIRGGV